MAVCDLDETIFIEYLPAELTQDGRPFLTMHSVARDRQWFETNKDKLKSFFDDYQTALAASAAAGPADRPQLPACEVLDGLYDAL